MFGHTFRTGSFRQVGTSFGMGYSEAVKKEILAVGKYGKITGKVVIPGINVILITQDVHTFGTGFWDGWCSYDE
jgi:hypothetical protein